MAAFPKSNFKRRDLVSDFWLPLSDAESFVPGVQAHHYAPKPIAILAHKILPLPWKGLVSCRASCQCSSQSTIYSSAE